MDGESEFYNLLYNLDFPFVQNKNRIALLEPITEIGNMLENKQMRPVWEWGVNSFEKVIIACFWWERVVIETQKEPLPFNYKWSKK